MRVLESKYRGAWRDRIEAIESVADRADNVRSRETLELDLDDPADYGRAVAIMDDAKKPWNPPGLR
jgi:hypothetical protein